VTWRVEILNETVSGLIPYQIAQWRATADEDGYYRFAVEP
jgi:hypothetical protein